MSGRVTLVQETGTDVQPGFLMYLPVYAGGAMPATVAERRRRLIGYVYSPFRANDLLQGILGDELADVDLEIYDGMRPDPAAGFYSSRSDDDSRPRYRSQARLDINDSAWLVRVTSRPAFEASIDRSKPRLVLAGGILISLLFFAVTWSLATTRERALALANRMHAALRSAHDDLERRVEARTAELQGANERLREALELNESIISTSLLGIVAFRASGDCVLANEAAAALVGATQERLRRQNFRQIASWRASGLLQRAEQALATGQPQRLEARLVSTFGKDSWLDCFLVPFSSRGEQRLLLTLVDIRERKLAEETIRQLAHYDPLTDLPNRRLFRDRLAQALAWADRAHSQVALFYLDLDRFKQVNDSLGHAAGDALLKTVAQRIAHSVREGDAVARLGGDEFAVIVSNMSHAEHAAFVAEKILLALREPCWIEGREVPVSASIGIGVYPHDTRDADELIRKADIALYHAKASGKNTFHFYSEEINQHSIDRLELESGLLAAIERQELHLEYQPLIHRESGGVFGVEALIRWTHPTLGEVSPNTFIPLAEEINAIDMIGQWALETACRELKRWDDDGLPPLALAVNLSAVQFRSKRLLGKVRDGVKRAAIGADRLILEITETALMEDAEAAVSTLTALRQEGFTIAIDDFGTGYSSLAYLQRLPVNELKIDRSFVENITDAGGGLAIAEAVIALARSLRLTVIAEGVETREQLDTLARLGCDKMQGYYFSRPLSSADLPRFMARMRWQPVARGAAAVH